MAIIVGVTALAVIALLGIGFALASGAWSKRKAATATPRPEAANHPPGPRATGIN